MSRELFNQYEKDYCDLSALLSREISELRSLRGEKLEAKALQLKEKRQDIQEALNSMELEIGGLPSSQAAELKGMWQGYKRDLTKLDTELADATKHAKLMSNRGELMDGAPSHFEDLESGMDQRRRMERVGEELEGQRTYINRAHEMTVELDEIGNRTRGKLREQRDTIQNQINQTDDTLRALGKTQRLIRGIKSRLLKNKIIIIVVILVLLAAVGTALYFLIIKPRVIDQLVTPAPPSAPAVPATPATPVEPIAPIVAPSGPPPAEVPSIPPTVAPAVPPPAQPAPPAPAPLAPETAPATPAAVVPWSPKQVIVTPSDQPPIAP